jgi:hypothetical protein
LKVESQAADIAGSGIRAQIGPRRKMIFTSRFKLIWPVQLSAQKYPYLRKSETVHTPRVLLPQEGRFAIVTSVGGRMRWTRRPRETSEANRTAKSCGPDPHDAGVKPCG